MECVVLAGGLGTRMRPATELVPKALISVAGRPFVDWQLDWLRRSGVTRVVYSIGYRGELLRAHVGDGHRFGVRVDLVDEGHDLRGTGGALRLALDCGALPPAFLVLYGDSYLSVALADVWDTFRALPQPALMTVMRNEGRWDKSNAAFDDGVVSLYDKGRAGDDAFDFIDYGLLALSSDVVAEIPSGEFFDMATLLHRLSLEGRLAGFEAQDRFYEIGTPAGLVDLEAYLTGARRSEQGHA
jgi:NDP-sugar pyrophosphorylase family protein